MTLILISNLFVSNLFELKFEWLFGRLLVNLT